MHSEILLFPNKTFYSGKIRCASKLDETRKLPKAKYFPWQKHVVIVDCKSGAEVSKQEDNDCFSNCVLFLCFRKRKKIQL
jgi:hypothetical protein